MGANHVHGCWVTSTDRVCEDGTKGCSREHPLAFEVGKPTGDKKTGEMSLSITLHLETFGLVATPVDEPR